MDYIDDIAAFYCAIEKADVYAMECAILSLKAGGLAQAFDKVPEWFPEFDPLGAKQFGKLWQFHGRNIRSHLRECVAPILRAYRHLNPPYTGPKLHLYRGESCARMRDLKYGLSWTPNELEARRLAEKDRWVDEGGGVVIRTDASGETVVAKIGEHKGVFEQEYMLDPSLLGEVTKVPNHGD